MALWESEVLDLPENTNVAHLAFGGGGERYSGTCVRLR